MVVEISVIPHKLQRYPTVGDWYLDPASGKLLIKVSQTGDWRADACIAVHELIEALLCRAAGIESHEVDAFDMAFEKNREPGNTDEPGDHPDAPYRAQHIGATQIELHLCELLGLDWKEYEKLVAKAEQ